MTPKLPAHTARCGCAAAFLLFVCVTAPAQDQAVTKEQLLQLQKQNERMQQQLKQQGELIDSLNRKVSEIMDSKAHQDKESETAASGENQSGGFRFGKIAISGEGGLAYFNSQDNGPFPHNEFRIDEAKLFIEAPVWKDVYFFGEINIATRESTDLNLDAGEVYLDFENVSKLWGRDRMLNIRVGRMDIPFGEEYQVRDAIDNPLISHSLSDIWGVDEGIELYGGMGQFQYAVAVQNGGVSLAQDFTSDKSVAGRIGYDPARWVHLSLSGMRTGDLSVAGDFLSELWFGTGWIRSIGGPGTTTFHANLAEADAQFHLPFVDLKTAAGYIGYNDNDPAANNHRDIYYYYVEGVHDWTKQIYSAVRFSQVFAHNGYPITGGGTMGAYFFSPVLTTEYLRMSLGLGYRFSRNLVIKGEYTFNRGQELNGDSRRHEDLFAIEAAFRF